MRIAPDGALESLQSQSSGKDEWVLVVPEGDARPGHSWKAFFFQSQHVGPFGGHRSADQTVELLRRYCHWGSMVKDVRAWVDG